MSLGGNLWCPRLRGAGVLPWLSHMTKSGFIGVRAIAGGTGWVETRPGSIGPTDDGSEPSRLDRVTGRGMKIGNKGWNAWEVISSDMGHEGISRSWVRRRRSRY